MFQPRMFPDLGERPGPGDKSEKGRVEANDRKAGHHVAGSQIEAPPLPFIEAVHRFEKTDQGARVERFGNDEITVALEGRQFARRDRVQQMRFGEGLEGLPVHRKVNRGLDRFDRRSDEFSHSFRETGFLEEQSGNPEVPRPLVLPK